MIKVSDFQEDIAKLNVYVPSHRTAKYLRQKLTELQEYN